MPLHFVSLAGHGLRSPESADALISRARALKAGLVIIDSFANLLRGAGESSLARVQPVLFNLRRLAEVCQAAVLVTHHTNRHGFFRGSSAISAAVDLMLSIESEPASDIINLRTLKARFPAPLPIRARALFETAADGSPRFSLTTAQQAENDSAAPPLLEDIPFPADTIEFSLLYDIQYHRQVTFDELHIRHIGSAEGSLRNALHELLKAGLIVRADGGKQGKKARYSLASRSPPSE